MQKYSDWRQLWYPNFEDFSRAEAIAGAENNTITNVTVQLGATAYLHCHVRNTGDRALAGAEVRQYSFRLFYQMVVKSLKLILNTKLQSY